MTDRILRKAEVRERTGLPVSTLYDMIRRGAFPAPVPLGPPGPKSRSVGWVASEVDRWVADRIASRQPAPDTSKVAAAVEARKARRTAAPQGERS